MYLRLLLPGLLLAAGLTSLSAPAAADPPPWAGHGRHHEREWRHDRWERERWERRQERQRQERHQERRAYDEGYYAPVPAYAPPRAYAPPPYAAPGIGVFVPFR